jgi:trk system potassium uptake protein TrkH
VASIASTAGFATVDYATAWPEFSKTLIVFISLMGGCAGSTAGGLKIARVIIVFKGMLCQIKRILRPSSVNVVRLDGEAVPDETVSAAMGYMSIYWAVIVAGTLIVSLDGYDFTTNVTAVITCVNNVGPGLGLVGPAGNFSIFSGFNKIVLSLIMMIGRLEIMPMLIFLSPMAWKKR